MQNGDFPIRAYRGFLAPKTISNLKIEPFAFENSNVSSQSCSKQRLGALQTTLPLICPYKNDRETVQNGDFPIWAYRGFLAPKTISNLKIEPFAFENSNVSSQNCSKERLGAFQTTLPLIYPYKNDRETVQNDDFPVRVGTFGAKIRLRQSDIMFIWPHCALLRPCTPPTPSGQVFPCFLALFSASTAI